MKIKIKRSDQNSTVGRNKSSLLSKMMLVISGLFAGFLLNACAPHAYVTLHSEPRGARVYTTTEKYIGTTPCKIYLGDLSKQLEEAGSLNLGELVAYKDGFAPVTRKVELSKNNASPFQDKSSEWEFLFNFKNRQNGETSSGATDFFACNYWLDEDQNSLVARDEFKGIKDHFRAFEKITFVALLKQGAGVNYSYQLQAPDGSICKINRDNMTKFKNTLAHVDYDVRDLIDARGVGLWKMQWLVEGNPVGITAVNLTH